MGAEGLIERLCVRLSFPIPYRKRLILRLSHFQTFPVNTIPGAELDTMNLRIRQSVV